jgi:ABC-type multidrug transport system ATPase subunit
VPAVPLAGHAPLGRPVSPPASTRPACAKRFGDLLALRHVDLASLAGGALGLLGRNAAGKATAIRILATLSRPTEDWISSRCWPLRERVSEGVTALLTTQCLEEADRLADEVVFLGDGDGDGD